MYEIRENYYALWLAARKQMEPEKAFACLDRGDSQSTRGRSGFTEETLIAKYFDLWGELGKQPNMYEWIRHTKISMNPIKRLFGKWSEFQKICIRRQDNGYFGGA